MVLAFYDVYNKLPNWPPTHPLLVRSLPTTTTTTTRQRRQGTSSSVSMKPLSKHTLQSLLSEALLSSSVVHRASLQAPNNQPNLFIIPRRVIMQSTNEEVPTVSPKTTATMHDYFKPADAKKAADVKRGRRLKKRKSIANESIDLDRRGKPSKSHRHDADRSARGLAPKPKDTTSSTLVATKTSTVAVSAPPPTKNKRTNHTVNGAMANAVEEWFRIKDAPNVPSKAAFARQKQLKPNTFKKYVHDVPEKRRKLGRHAGRPSLLSESNSQFLMQHTIRADHANNCLTPAQIIENMNTLQPELSQQQSRNHTRNCDELPESALRAP